MRTVTGSLQTKLSSVMNTTPFGRFAEPLTTITAAFVIAVAVGNYVFGWQADSAFLDNMAWLAFGAMFGTRAAANGYAKSVNAAHRRLDLIGAPSDPATTDKVVPS